MVVGTITHTIECVEGRMENEKPNKNPVINVVIDVKRVINGQKQMWRLMSNALAVRENLQRRGTQVSPLCAFCDKNEYIEHMLFAPFGKLSMRKGC